MGEETRRFECTPLANERYRELRLGRLGAIWIIVLVSALEAASLLKIAGRLPGYPSGASASLVFVLIGGLATLAVALEAYLVDFGVRPATAVVLESSGIRIVYPAARVRFFAWKGHRGSLKVMERERVGRTPLPAEARDDRRYSIAGVRPRSSPIPAEAFREILKDARARGSNITVKTRDGSQFRQTTYRIEPPA